MDWTTDNLNMHLILCVLSCMLWL